MLALTKGKTMSDEREATKAGYHKADAVATTLQKKLPNHNVGAYASGWVIFTFISFSDDEDTIYLDFGDKVRNTEMVTESVVEFTRLIVARENEEVN